MLYLRVLFVIACIGLVISGRTAGHGAVERSSPVDGSTVSQSPSQISIWYDEPLIPNTATVTILDMNGQQITPISVAYSPDDSTLIVATIPENLPDSVYIVNVSAAVVSDGHQSKGSFVFWVSADTAQDVTSIQPSYWIVGVFAGVALLLGSIGVFWWRVDELRVERPTAESDGVFDLRL